MVITLDYVPTKKADTFLLPKTRPKIMGEPGLELVNFDGLVIPQSFNKRLFARCNVDIKPDGDSLTKRQVENRIERTAREKEMYLRYAKDKPLALVTNEFKEINPRNIAKKTQKIIGAAPIVRYFQNDESVQMNFPLDERFEGLYLVVSTGPYGIYGGSGSNAIKYGISWFNKTCSNWTMFLGKDLLKTKGRVIHKNNSTESLDNLLACANTVPKAIEDSKNNYFTNVQLMNYFENYTQKGLPKQMGTEIVQSNPLGMNAYDLSYRLTELCQNEKLSDTTRARVEYIAGEVILCYDSIINGINNPIAGTPNIRRTGQQRAALGPMQYVRAN